MQRHIPVTTSKSTEVKNDIAWPEQGIEFVLPATGWQGFTSQPLAVADERVLTFCAALSRRLLALGREWPDLAALGFWLRPIALKTHLQAYRLRSPLGLTLHLVPSNVPTLASSRGCWRYWRATAPSCGCHGVRIRYSNSCWLSVPSCWPILSGR